MSNNRLAVVPYDIGKSFDFYENKLIVGGRTISYDDIEGYGYITTHTTTSIYYIPFGNSKSFELRLDLGSEIYRFKKTASAPITFSSEKQKTIDLIVSELVQLIDIIIAPRVYVKCMEKLMKGESITIGTMTVSSSELTKHLPFGRTKSLPIDQYMQTDTKGGSVDVFKVTGKHFYNCPLSEINAPLAGRILDTLAGKNE